jgi:hypothetical protein
MKFYITNLLSSVFFVFVLISTSSAQAECVYDQALKAEEFSVGLMLTWRTLLETNNQDFVVEKSEDGKNFKSIGTVKAAGNSKNLKSYNFLDPQANKKKLYYRLRQTDFDGTSSYSDILDTEQKQGHNWVVARISSESTASQYTVTIDSYVEGGSVLRVLDAAGSVVWRETRHLRQGLNALTVDFANLREGVYKVILSSAAEEKEFVVRRISEEFERSTKMALERKKNTKN